MGERGEQTLGASRGWLIGVGLPLLVGLSGLFKVRDLDVWWRVRTGQWIWDHGSIPDTDPFSHTAQGPWNCVEAGANLFLYAFHKLVGPLGLSFAGAVMALLVGFAVSALAHYTIERGPRVGTVFLAVGLFVGAASFRFGPKPELFSLAGLALLLLILHAVDRTHRWRLLFFIPLLVFAWAWLHRGSTVSIPVLGAAIVVWAGRNSTRRLAWTGMAALIVSVVAMLLTPGMSESLASAGSVVSSEVYTKYIGEWRPLSLGSLWSTMPLLLPLTILWLLVAPVQRRFHFGTLIVVGLGYMAIRHVRFVPLFALAMVPEVAWGLARTIDLHSERLSEQVRPAVLRWLLVAAALAAMAMSYLERPIDTWGAGPHDFHRPVHAAEFLAANPPPGRMFNTFNYGGYLLYALGPEQKVFIDGRNDQVYRPEFFAQAAVTPGNQKVLAHLVESQGLSYAVLQCTKMVNHSYTWLYGHPNWRVVYMDDKASVLVKKTPESAAYLDKHAYEELNPSTAMARAKNPAQDARRSEFGREVIRHVAQSPHSIRAHFLAALVHRNEGRHQMYQAESETVARLVAERGLNIVAP